MSQGGRQGQGCRRMGRGLPKGQGHRRELKWSSLEGQLGEDTGARKRDWIVRGWVHSGWQMEIWLEGA